MGLSLTILGANSAIPTATRFPTSQLLQMGASYYLIDCGEGTQIQLRRNRIRLQRISAIFISHLHGDHYFGLVGLLNTFHLLGRRKELHVFGPPGLKDILDLQMQYSKTKLCYTLHFTTLEMGESKEIYSDKAASMRTIPMNHSIPCNGFLFREHPKKRKIIKEKTESLNVPISELPNLKDGKDYVDEKGVVHANTELTLDPNKSYSYAYCSDTAYDERVVPHISGVDVLYHEATFLTEMENRAETTYHATARQAATIAKMAGAGQLILGHYSARYNDFEGHKEEAQAVFENTDLAVEGKVFAYL